MERLKLKPGEIQLISPPVIQARLTGTQYATLSRNNVLTLVYEDGSKESTIATNEDIEQLDGNYFSVVSLVQSRRKKEFKQ
jgi:hypothetical protein